MEIQLLLVGLGGGLGALLRAFLTDRIKERWTGSFPLTTFGINVSGSFFLGLLLGGGEGTLPVLLMGTGMLGGFTTFSTFQYEAVALLKTGKVASFLGYYLASPILGLSAAWVALQL